uniref:Uncharacterized protein n=1 Tax=Plectus sambesii TaxID=2011161 RepID=A0A914UIC9_9BILA
MRWPTEFFLNAASSAAIPESGRSSDRHQRTAPPAGFRLPTSVVDDVFLIRVLAWRRRKEWNEFGRGRLLEFHYTPQVFSSMRVLRFASISMDKATKCLLWLRIAVVVFLVIAWALVAGEKGFEKVDGLLTGLIFGVFGSVIAAASGAFFFSRFSQQVSLLV